MDKFFILVQGPYSQNTRNLIIQLHQIFSNFRIVLSIYDEYVDEIIFNLVEVRRNLDPGTFFPPPKYKPINLIRQATTIHTGCGGANEEWVMKIRSDLEILDGKKLLSCINEFENSLRDGKPLKLMSLNTGCFDIFCYYEMPLHFNDLFFICHTSVLKENSAAIKRMDQENLVGFKKGNIPKNYRHYKKYNLRFHVEQLIHFGHALNKGYWLEYCCDMKSSGKFRHIIWVGKHLMVFKMRDIGLRSTKVGYPSYASNLISVTPNIIGHYSKLLNSSGPSRMYIMQKIKFYGKLRFIIYKLIKLFNLFFYFSKKCLQIFKLIFFTKNTQ